MPPRWTNEPKDIALMLGNAIVINCLAEGYPEPNITWFKGGKNSIWPTTHKTIDTPIMCSFSSIHINKFDIHAEGKTSKEFKSIQVLNNSLVVDFATDADEGYYMCQANNGIGSGLKKIFYINVNGSLLFRNKCNSHT